MDLLATKSKQNNFVSHFSFHFLRGVSGDGQTPCSVHRKRKQIFGGDERGRERDWRRRKRIFAIEERRGEEN